MDEKELKKRLTELKSTPDKLSLVRGLIDCQFNKTEALKKIGKSKSWLYSIPEDELEELIEIAKEYNFAIEMRTMDIIKNAVTHAAEVQVKLLDSRDDRVKQAASIQVLDRVIGKATDKLDVTSDGKQLPQAVVNIFIPDNGRNS
jgi:CO dehydrogenase/acetyl-CoA synthase gamma subunit (corrinoid Fe-S protein)